MIEPKERVNFFQENYELITESIDELIFIINHKNEIEYINKLPLMKLMGYNVDDLMGKSWLNYVHTEDLEKAINTLESCSEGNRISLEIRLQHRNGNFKTFKSNYSKTNRSPRTDQTLIILRDLTPLAVQKEAEDKEGKKSLSWEGLSKK